LAESGNLACTELALILTHALRVALNCNFTQCYSATGGLCESTVVVREVHLLR